jgi:alkyl hydroperoxide reductase subunit AhpF
MPKLVDAETEKQVRAQLKGLVGPVTLVYFTQQISCAACRERRGLLEELVALSDKLRLEARELVADDTEAKRYGIDKVPATIVLGERDPGIRFYGLSGGYEFTSLLEAMLMVSTGRSSLPPEIEAMVAALAADRYLGRL